jgi:AcrR family transcriptional regulator
MPDSSQLKRHDVARERVLDAFEEAVLEHGVQASSFARIAAIGGFHRTLIQHHFGKRDVLVMAALDRIVEQYVGFTRRLVQRSTDEERVDVLVGWLLSPFGPSGPPRIASVVDAYQALANTEPEIRTRIRDLYEAFCGALEDALLFHAPHAALSSRRDAAITIVALSFGRAGLDTLGMPEAAGPGVRAAARAVVASLN